MDLTELTASAAAAALRRGDITAEAYADALLAQCRKHQRLNAFIAQDAERVKAAARQADQARAAGKPTGALHGLPLALKDNFDTVGLPTTGGTPGLKSNRPKQNAKVVQPLLDAGAIVLGKANMHELAYGITSNNGAFGPARNPYDPSRIPGGSSGGTGVAVGARMAPAGLGSDTGGSVRVPAALCGIVGFRPTTLRYSQAGIVPISHTRDTAGPMTRSVADIALLDGIITGGPTAVQPASLKGLRLGIPRGHFNENLEAETARILAAVLERLKAAGVVLVEGDAEDVAALDASAGFPIALYETVTDLNQYLAAHGSKLDYAGLVAQCGSPDVKGLLQSLLGAGAVPEAAYREAVQKTRPALQQAYAKYFSGRDVRAMLFPTTPLPAAKIGEDETVMLNGVQVPTFPTFIRNTGPGSVGGIPGLSLPAGLTAQGLPVGIELDAPEGHDQQLLAIGAAIETILPKLPPPKL